MSVSHFVRLVAASMVAFVGVSSAPVVAQPTDTVTCQGTAARTSFGVGCLQNAELTPLTDQDYGIVHINFTPPTTPEDVIPARALNGTWLERLAQRSAAQSVRSATVLLEVRTTGGDLVASDPSGTPLALVQLATYDYDSRGRLKFNEGQDFANRELAARLLLTRGQTIRARVRVVFTQQDPSSLVETLRPFVGAASAFGGSGFVVNAYSSPQLMRNLTNIENLLRSPGNVEAAGDNWFDLNYESGPNQLVYDFQLNPRGRNAEPRQKGRLTLSLRRRPSLFTDQVLPGQPGHRLPDYGIAGRLDSAAIDRLWANAMVAPGMSAERFAAQSGFDSSLRVFQSGSTPEATFDEMCEVLHRDLNRMGQSLSLHDRTALFWAAFVQGQSAMRPEIQQRRCIARDRDLWASYGLVLPQTNPPRPPLPTPQMRDAWIRIAAGALRDPDPRTRNDALIDLFNPQVMVTISPNTLYGADDPVPAPNSVMDRVTLVRDMRVLIVGCRFAVAPDAPRFSVLARRPDNNKLLTLTIDYGGRVGGVTNVEVTGLQVRETTEADWTALAAMNDLRPACQASNREYAPGNPPATPPQP